MKRLLLLFQFTSHTTTSLMDPIIRKKPIKPVFHKCYLVHSSIPWPKCSTNAKSAHSCSPGHLDLISLNSVSCTVIESKELNTDPWCNINPLDFPLTIEYWTHSNFHRFHSFLYHRSHPWPFTKDHYVNFGTWSIAKKIKVKALIN